MCKMHGHGVEYHELALGAEAAVGGAKMKSKLESCGRVADLAWVDKTCQVPGLLGGDWRTYRQLVDSNKRNRTTSEGCWNHPDQAAHMAELGAVEVCIFWMASPRSLTTEVHQPSSECGRIVIQRVMASAPESNVTEKLNDACDDYVAKRIMDPAWAKFSQVWATPICEGLASAAETVSGLHDQLHELVLGSPIEELTGFKPLASIGAEVALPGDGLFRTAKLLIEGAGIVMGLLAHQPLLLNACLKSFTHDAALHALSKGVGNLLADTCSPGRTRQQKITSPKQLPAITFIVRPAGTTESISCSPGQSDQHQINIPATVSPIFITVMGAGTTPSWFKKPDIPPKSAEQPPLLLP